MWAFLAGFMVGAVVTLAVVAVVTVATLKAALTAKAAAAFVKGSILSTLAPSPLPHDARTEPLPIFPTFHPAPSPRPFGPSVPPALPFRRRQ